ncbi:MAG: hypothetical protein MUE41_13400 [Gemmatimonadaceae bacterium]|jgi:hypothetical protein|nr:hypothetical protein [Gemmatimonadaceae bacterium]
MSLSSALSTRHRAHAVLATAVLVLVVHHPARAQSGSAPAPPITAPGAPAGSAHATTTPATTTPTTATHAPAAHALAGTTRLTLALGHMSLSQGVIDGDRRWLSVPSWALNVDRWIGERWAIALQGDLVIESYRVEHGDRELLERAYPVSLVPALLWKPARGTRWTLVGGVGAEYASGHTLALTRLGIEYGVHLGDRHEVGILGVWDNKWNYYNSIAIGFTVARLWSRTAPSHPH